MIPVLAAMACTTSSTPLELQSGASVEVGRIVKGDELEVERDGSSARLRMLGVYAFSAVLDDPQLDALELRAKDWLEGHLERKTVRIVLGEVPKDKSGRFLGYVEQTGTDVNRTLVAEGRAVVYTEYPFEREASYLAAETEARSQRRGVWATDAAVELVRGLRKQWTKSRADPAFQDPLLAKVAQVPDAVTRE